MENSVLVTGATGFLGQKLCQELKKSGYCVTGIGRNKKIGKELNTQGINFKVLDITDAKGLKKVSKNHQFVIHCAALSSLWGKYEDFYQANVIGTKSVVDACLANQVQRLVHISTPSLYFNFSDRLNIKENDALPTKFINHYATTKFLAEELVDQAFSHGLETIILRPRAIFGPKDTTLLPRLININQKMGVPLINGGQQLTDVTYIDNVIHAIILSLNSPSNSLGKKYNITNGQPITLIDLFTKLFSQIEIEARFKKVNFKLARNFALLLELISKIFQGGKEPVLTQYAILAIGKSMTLNIDQAKTYLGYSPKVSLKEGISRYTQWWKDEMEK